MADTVTTPDELRKELSELVGGTSPFWRTIADYYPGFVDPVDPEVLHRVMDSALCRVLRELGYGDAVDIFLSAPK